MVKQQEFYIDSTNKSNKLRVLHWAPQNQVVAVLQISHGMIEHIGRYENFAIYLAERGIAVIGNDHLGHGKSVKNQGEWGYFNAEESSKTVVDDLHEVTLIGKKMYPSVPYFVLGHSMGSFMIRRYMMTYGNEINGVIIMGTGDQPPAMVKLQKMAYYSMRALRGDTYNSKMVHHAIMGGYNRKFSPTRTASDWISRDPEAVDAYVKDPYCGFIFSLNGYKTIFETFEFINNPDHINKVPKALPILMVAGDKDPVGNNGKGVTKIYNLYKVSGMENIELKLYSECRHELLNELNREEVYGELYNWLKRYM